MLFSGIRSVGWHVSGVGVILFELAIMYEILYDCGILFIKVLNLTDYTKPLIVVGANYGGYVFLILGYVFSFCCGYILMLIIFTYAGITWWMRGLGSQYKIVEYICLSGIIQSFVCVLVSQVLINLGLTWLCIGNSKTYPMHLFDNVWCYSVGFIGFIHICIGGVIILFSIIFNICSNCLLKFVRLFQKMIKKLFDALCNSQKRNNFF